MTELQLIQTFATNIWYIATYEINFEAIWCLFMFFRKTSTYMHTYMVRCDYRMREDYERALEA